MGDELKDIQKQAPTLLKGLQAPFSGSAVQFVNQRLAPAQSLDQAQALEELGKAGEQTLQALETEYKFLLAYQLGETAGQAGRFDTKTWNLGPINVGVILALLVVTGFLGVVILFFFTDLTCDMDDGYRDLLIMLLGALTSVTVQVFQFFFGSSAGSAGKSQLIMQQARKRR
jgi:hypothetical protein